MSKILITSAIPYVNGVKHLGNLVGSLLPADVHARFRRQIGDEVLFICGTDEHGTPAELGAIEAGEDVRGYCGSLLDPIDLIRPRSALSGNAQLELRESRHLFLRQSLLADRLNDWVDSRYIQFLGKDNVPFHAVSFPATLLGSGEPWKTVDVIKGFHWLNYEGGKFSTSRRRGIFADAALSELPAELWRWWLIANAPETSDTDFTVQRFATDVNKDLGDVFGNLVNRLVRFAAQAFGGRVPVGGKSGEREQALAAEVGERVARLRQHHESLEFRRAAAETRAIWARANAYLQETAPWTAINTDPDRAAVITRTALNLVCLSAVLAWSIVPTLARTVLSALGEDAAIPSWPTQPGSDLLQGALAERPIGAIGPLVAKLADADTARLFRRFAGDA